MLQQLIKGSDGMMASCIFGHLSFGFPSQSRNMEMFFVLSMSCSIFFTMISATHPSPIVFRCTPCCVKLFLLRLISNIFTLSIAMKILCIFLLNTWTSILMHNVSCKSCLCGAASAMIFVLLLWFMKSFKCLGPIGVSFLLTTFKPPHMTTASSLVSVIISLWTKAVTFARPDPAMTIPLTSNSFLR